MLIIIIIVVQFGLMRCYAISLVTSLSSFIFSVPN